MIVICEPQSISFEHSPFNAALITVIKYAFPEEEIIFLAEKDHISYVKKFLDSNSITIKYQKIKIPKPNIIDPIRFPSEIILLNKIFNFTKKLNSKKIIFCSIRRPGIVASKILIRKYNDIKCVTVLHSILEATFKAPFEPTEIPFWFRFWISFANIYRLRYMILGPSIEKELLKKLPNLEKFVFSIDHPYLYQEKIRTKKTKKNVIRFGFFGVGNTRKGIDLFLKLSNEISKEKTKYKPEFILIGHILNESFGPITLKKNRNLDLKSVFVPSPNKPLSRNEFDHYANDIDYALILHKAKEYRLSATGSFFDAISYSKPIIALKNPFITYYFNKMGNIGYLCDNYEEIKKIILNILNNDKSTCYSIQRENILREREEINLKKISKKIAKDLW